MCLELRKQDGLKRTLSVSLQILQSDSGVFRFPENRKRLDWGPVCTAVNQLSGMPNVCGGARSWLMVREILGEEQIPEREEDKQS